MGKVWLVHEACGRTLTINHLRDFKIAHGVIVLYRGNPIQLHQAPRRVVDQCSQYTLRQHGALETPIDATRDHGPSSDVRPTCNELPHLPAQRPVSARKLDLIYIFIPGQPGLYSDPGPTRLSRGRTAR